jgi:predicted transcriptional regulator
VSLQNKIVKDDATTLTIRIDSALKHAVETIAAERDETLSQVIRRALRDYVAAQSRRLIQST